jgi:hypothetical protein
MRKIIALLLFTSIFTGSFSQQKTKISDFNKSMLIGSALTIGGAGALVGAGFTLPIGFSLLDSDDENILGAGIGYTVGGCLLLCVGITGAVAGPIILAHGVKNKREAKPEATTLGFAPVQNKLLDKYQCSYNNQKFATLSFSF